MALKEYGVPRSNKHVDQIPQGERIGTNGTARDYSVVFSNGPAGSELRMPSLGSSIPRFTLAIFDHFTGDGHLIMTTCDAVLHDRPKPRINLRRSRGSQEVRMCQEYYTHHGRHVCHSEFPHLLNSSNYPDRYELIKKRTQKRIGRNATVECFHDLRQNIMLEDPARQDFESFYTGLLTALGLPLTRSCGGSILYNRNGRIWDKLHCCVYES